MYRYYVTKRNPVAAWMLDDTTPFQECTGSGLSAIASAGTPTASTPLVRGAGYSSVLNRNNVARFDCNLFRRGLEGRRFALEAWVLPIPKSYGVEQERVNRIENPSPSTSYWNSNSGTVAPFSLDTNSEGRPAARITRATTGTAYLRGGNSTSYEAPFETIAAGMVITMLYSLEASEDMVVNSIVAYGSGSSISGLNANHSLSAGQVHRFARTVTVPSGVWEGSQAIPRLNMANNSTIGSWLQVSDVAWFEGEYQGEYFDGSSPGATWDGAPEDSFSRMQLSSADQQILSHEGAYDGLSINGATVRFETSYLESGRSYCEFDLEQNRLAHVVGVHNQDQNQLWVNGELVSSVNITEEQKGDTYASADSQFLYCGNTISSQELAVNGVAVYRSISSEDILRNYEAGIDFIGQDRVYPQLGGTTFDMDSDSGSVFIEESWTTREDFVRGLNTNVVYTDERILPADANAGFWTVSIPLDAMDDTSIYGVAAIWAGRGIALESSLDGTTWVPVVSGRLMSNVTAGMNPAGKDLQIRAAFGPNLSEDESYLDSLRVVGFRNNKVRNVTAREVTVSHPAVLRNDYEPNLYRDDNGISLSGGSLTIGTDPTADPDIARTLELWIKPLSGTPSVNVAGTKYRNGAVDSTLPVGEWSLVHYVANANITQAIVISGNAIVGQATIYPTALSAGDITALWKSYTGNRVVRHVDSTATGISETATPASIYAHDWSISAAG